jgi:putative membrane protein
MMYGYGYGPGAAGGGGWLFGMALMALFGLVAFAGFVLLVIWAVRTWGGPSHHAAQPPSATPPRDPACDIARERYARGEITKEQYDEICRTLAGG